ncbi:relaxase/mobilization nuclease domain-containing protein [Burkholderia vietnamiensis]|uniref:relaxase/mobilization nuclease domain-containing protein n=2 Tax=Burkholderiaceae TaxID=119060 RepID=UPI001BA23290|nr:relaxase/mobilization nuclease domain-containing protein [Burkholderia vietnamiensis]
MIVKNFSTGRNSVSNAVNYLLSEKNWKGNDRDSKPEVLKGDPELTKQIGKDLRDRFSSKYLSGVISLAEGEKLTDQQKQELISSFEKTFMPGMEGRFNALYVAHGNNEIHYVVNKVDLETGKAFNPMPPGHEKMKDLFQRTENFKYGFEQVVRNPEIGATKYSHEEQKALIRNQPFGNLSSKQELDNQLKSMVGNGLINSREEMISTLQENGFILSRVGKDYISIQTEGKNIRLRGGIYEQGNQQSYKEIVRERAESSDRERAYSKNDCQRDREELTKLVEKRISYNNKTFQRGSTGNQMEHSVNSSLGNNRNISRRLNDTSLSEKSNSQGQNRHHERSSISGNHEGAVNKLTSESRQKPLLHTNTGELNDRVRNKFDEALGEAKSISSELDKRSSEISKSSDEFGEKSNQFESHAGRFSEALEETMIDSKVHDLSSLSIKKKLGELGMKSQAPNLSKAQSIALDYKIAEMSGQLALAEARDKAQYQRSRSFDFDR